MDTFQAADPDTEALLVWGRKKPPMGIHTIGEWIPMFSLVDVFEVVDELWPVFQGIVRLVDMLELR